MAHVVANGVKFHVLRQGSGDETTVFIHGMAIDNLSSWWFTVANTISLETSVLLYDLRGHGLSDRPPTGYSLDDMVADLAAILTECGIEGPVHLAGNSFGGLVALAFALAHPERVASMILVEAPIELRGHRIESGVVGVGLTLGGEFITNEQIGNWIGLLGEKRAIRMAGSFGDLLIETSIITDLAFIEPFSPTDLAAITAPTLLVFGAASTLIDQAQVLNEKIPGSRLAVVPGADHLLVVENPPELLPLVRDWVVQKGWSRAAPVA